VVKLAIKWNWVCFCYGIDSLAFVARLELLSHKCVGKNDVVQLGSVSVAICYLLVELVAIR